MKYGFIGCGNMGGAIAKALCRQTADIMIADPSPNAKAAAEALGAVYTDNETLVATCDRVFLAVKPHLMKGMLTPLAPILADKKPLLITMAAGLEIAQIRGFAGCDLPIIRIMPNTSVSIGKGMIQYCRNGLVSDETLADWLSDMQDCGRLDELEERLIDAASALSGSGPAYMYMFLEALADGAVACGIPRAKAYEYAAMTMAGAAEMVLTSGQHPGALKDAVCSPGGSTIAGVRALEQNGFRGAAMDCVMAGYLKNKELGKQ
ncbi:MAG: pyrroline-5-carboxylate reductase [Oscillospiraceae bacterium]|nr:pyrroline-5-carboxylate reductase [Oscillospiraceae bacterium]MBQ7129715.1 pyrroline-5-carboxylate reductase [Oscillospiraceae bacterium]